MDNKEYNLTTNWGMPNHNIIGDVSNGGIWLHGVYGITSALYSLTKPMKRSGRGTLTTFVDDPMEVDRMISVANRLAHRRNGEEKFLRFIDVHLEVSAPRAWWSHMDTYHFVVKQSESTTHRIKSFGFVTEDFENCPEALVIMMEDARKRGASMETLKHMLPESYLQSRVVKINYNTLQTIWIQRSKHAQYKWWQKFFMLYTFLPFNEWIRPEVKK
jgi:hypothetical protein